MGSRKDHLPAAHRVIVVPNFLLKQDKWQRGEQGHENGFIILQGMNYLAHAFLSFEQPDLLVGNMIADFVKGRQILQYDAAVQDGIRLHRAIDEFTDQHAVTRKARALFQPICGGYAAVFMDVVYDHYLANDPLYFSRESLQLFSQKTYASIDKAEAMLPEPFVHMFGYMREGDWLVGYRELPGIEKAFMGIAHRAKYLASDTPVLEVLEKHYQQLNDYYQLFMPTLYDFVRQKISSLDRQDG